VRWCTDGDFWRLFCVLYFQRADQLKAQCRKVIAAAVLANDTRDSINDSDVDGLALFDELQCLDVLRYLQENHLHETFPNVSYVCEFYFIIAVTIA